MFQVLTLSVCLKGGYLVQAGNPHTSGEYERWAFSKLEEAITFIDNNIVHKDSSPKTVARD
jgi:hypothetical protein